MLVLPPPYVVLTCRYAGTPITICCINMPSCWYSQHLILTCDMLVLPAPCVTCKYAGTPKTIFEHANVLYSQHRVLTCRYAGTPRTIYWLGGMPVLPKLCWHVGLLVLRTPYVDMPDCGRPQRNVKIRNSEPVVKFVGHVSSSELMEARGWLCSLHLGKELQKPSCGFLALASWG